MRHNPLAAAIILGSIAGATIGTPLSEAQGIRPEPQRRPKPDAGAAEQPLYGVLMDDDPLLRTISAPVENFDEDLAGMLVVMRRIASGRRALGLAAVQIGVPVRVLIAKSDSDDEYLAFINPTLDRTLNRFATHREGCLSIPPRLWGDVSRPAKCDASWLDEAGEPHSATLTGRLARIFQHEFDHLNGILMTDHRAAAFQRLQAGGG